MEVTLKNNQYSLNKKTEEVTFNLRSVDLENYKSHIMWDLDLIEEDDCEDCKDISDYDNDELLDELKYRGVEVRTEEMKTMVEQDLLDRFRYKLRDLDLRDVEEVFTLWGI